MARKEVRALANANVPPFPSLTFPNDMPLFRFWLQRMLPTVYTDAMSYSELLDKVIEYLNSVIEDQNDVNEDLKALYEYVEQLYHYMSDDPASQFIDQLEAYIDQHLIDYVARMAYYVFPTLQKFDDGSWHYVIKVPQSWKQLHFSWIWDETDNVWKLVLLY